MSSVFGICNLHDSPALGRLTKKRPLGAVTFLGRYGLMDFTLSNFSNSGIDRVGLLIEEFPHAIMSHVQSGNVWINNTRTGFQRLFSNEKTAMSPKFNTDLNNILYNKNSFFDINADYFVISSPTFLASMDFRPLLKKHIESNKDVSVVYYHTADTEGLERCDSLKISKSGEIEEIVSSANKAKSADVSLQTYILSKEALIKIVNLTREISSLFNLREMIAYIVNNKLFAVNSIKFNGFVIPMLSFENYVKYSMKLLDFKVRSQLFLDDWPIYTTTHNTPPVLYGKDADVSNSFIANGSIVKGTVKNSVISRDVIIEEGAVVENCILFTKTVVGKNVKLKYVVSDKEAKIKNCKEVIGKKDNIVFIDFGEII